jgi:hypothetical protein
MNRFEKVAPDWEIELPPYIQTRTINEGQKASQELISKLAKELEIPILEAIALVTYTRGLDMPISDYENSRRILDAGAGLDKLKSVLEKLRISSSVTSLDNMKNLRKQSPTIDVQGEIQSLPFANESFDTIVANYAIPWTIDKDVDPNFMSNQLTELIRTLKTGGTLRYRPIRMYRAEMRDLQGPDPMKLIFANAIEELKRAYTKDPTLKITLIRAYDDDGKSFDEILEVIKPSRQA